MALPPTIYKVAIDLSDLDRNCYQQLNCTVARHPSETAERLVTRLLAYALCYQEGLTFTRGICAGDEPDLWRKGADGRVVDWIEVGLPDPERLVKASRHAEQVKLLLCGQGVERWKTGHLLKLSSIANLGILAVERALVNGLVDRLQRGVNWSLTVTEGTLYLTLAEETLEGKVESLV